MEEPKREAGQPVDAAECEKEPIHIPGRIQPHGALLVLKEPELTIVQISDTAATVLGRPADALLGQRLESLLGPAQIDYLKDSLLCEKVTTTPLHLFTMTVQQSDTIFDGIAHCAHGSLVLELEPVRPQEKGSASNLQYLLRTAIPKLHEAKTLQQFCEAAARQVRQITGFDRVMMYRFDEDWNGTVIAEDRRDDLDSFLGLYFPASDIPRQAREIYLRNPLRLIADVHAEPVPVVPVLNPLTNRPLDMTFSVLRSVSPIHIEYLKNMGVAASMSIGIVREGRLWGLIACHHLSARYVPYDVRMACELFGQVVSLQVATKEESEDYEYRMTLKSRQASFVASMSTTGDFVQGLLDHHPNLLDFIDAQGVALCVDGDCFLLGQTPDEAEVRRLVDWLARHRNEAVFQTNALPAIYERAESFKQTASGLLAVPLSRVRKNYLCWFRPEVIQTVNWAGNPEKTVEAADDGLRLSPRKSFALWKETVRSQSLPWKACETEAAGDLRNAVTGVVLHLTELKRAEQALNAAYERERRIADTLQLSFLRKPTENAFPRLDVEPLYEAAWEEAAVGGDFFDAFALEDGRVALVVGDVAGKGLAAATRTMEVKFALRAFLSEYPEPGQALSRLNEFMCDAQKTDDVDGRSFVALALVVVNPESGEASCTLAGAEPPCVLREDGEAEELLPGDLPLGVVGKVAYPTQTLRLGVGDTVLIATDGITEARNREGFLGHEGMMQLARQALPLGSLRRIGQSILDGARAFARGPLKDDACLLLARRR